MEAELANLKKRKKGVEAAIEAERASKPESVRAQIRHCVQEQGAGWSMAATACTQGYGIPY